MSESADDIVPRAWSLQQIRDLAFALHKVATDRVAEVLLGLTDEERQRLRFAARQLDVVAGLRTGTVAPPALQAYELDDGGEQHYLAAPNIVAAVKLALQTDLISDEVDEVHVTTVSESLAAGITVSRRDDGLPPSTVLAELKSSTEACILCSTVY